MLQDVDERVLRQRRVLRRPVADALHGVLVEDTTRVIAEPLVEIRKLSVGRRIGAQLEHGSRALRRRHAARLEDAAEREPCYEYCRHRHYEEPTRLRHRNLHQSDASITSRWRSTHQIQLTRIAPPAIADVHIAKTDGRGGPMMMATYTMARKAARLQNPQRPLASRARVARA